MNIGIVGTGYVGLITGCILSNHHFVTCCDNNREKVDKLNNKEIPIYENNLDELFNKNFGKSLFFTDDIKELIEKNDVVFISVGTPPNEDGSADMKYVYEVARSIGQNINAYKVIVDKSTVPIGTAKIVKSIIEEEMLNRKVWFEFDVVSNPEFLREGNAVADMMNPDRIVIGSESKKAIGIMKDVYSFYDKVSMVITNTESAEMIKYASNAFLATKISYINELALLCEKVGANVIDVAKGMGMDKRIGNKFLNAGCGYGGSCFPKDTRALTEIAKKNDCELLTVNAAITANQNQRKKSVEKIINVIGDLKDKTIGVLGLSFKPETDDCRESPSLYIIKELIKCGAKIKVYDPEGMEEFKWRMADYLNDIHYCRCEYEALEECDFMIVLTEWKQFKDLNFAMIKDLLREPILFDLRNMFYNDVYIKNNFKYYGIGI